MKQLNRTARVLYQPMLLLLTAWVTGPAVAEPATNTMQQRVQPCMACHAAKGINLQSGYVPSLHGKPAGYLFNQLVNYQTGRRQHRAMEHMVSNLSAEYLWEMAVYFAELDAAYPEPAPPPDNPGLRDRGLELVTRGDQKRGIPACQACHGERLTGVQPNTPSLLGLPSHYVAAQMNAWRMGRRQAADPDCMRDIVERLEPEDIHALARWLAAQPAPENPEPRSEPISDMPMECGSVQPPEQ